MSRLIRVLILREAVRAPDTHIAADICLAAKMAQELEIGTLRNVTEVVLNQCEPACGPRTDAKSSVEPTPLGEEFLDVGYIHDHAVFGCSRELTVGLRKCLETGRG